MKKRILDKKLYSLVILLLSITIIIFFLIKNPKENKKAESNTDTSKEQPAQENFLPKPSQFSIIPGYKLDNDIMP